MCERSSGWISPSINEWYQCVLCRYRLSKKEWKKAKFKKCPRCGTLLNRFEIVKVRIDYSGK